MTASGERLLRVVLTGPESTGKSMLTGHLARRFRVPFAMEYARAYLEAHGSAYDYERVREMARGHGLHQRAQVPDAAPLGVLDTDLINYKIWCEVVYGRCPEEIREGVERETDHVYLLCAPDVPWAPDPLRENPNDRPALFERHRREIQRLNRPYVIIAGADELRFRNAEAAFRQLTGRGDSSPSAW